MSTVSKTDDVQGTGSPYSTDLTEQEQQIKSEPGSDLNSDPGQLPFNDRTVDAIPPGQLPPYLIDYGRTTAHVSGIVKNRVAKQGQVFHINSIKHL